MAEDRKMNDFMQVTNAEYIYAEAADRSQVKMKKKDLAVSLTGLFPIKEFYTTISINRVYVIYIPTTETGMAIGELITYNPNGALEMKPFISIINEGKFAIGFETGLPKESKLLVIYHIFTDN